MRHCRTAQPDTLLNNPAPTYAASLGLSLLGVSVWLVLGLMPVSMAADMPVTTPAHINLSASFIPRQHKAGS